MVRFSDWDAILAEPQPAHDSAFTGSIWRYARALALINRGQVDDAERELPSSRRWRADPSLKGQTTFSANSGTAIVQIAPEIVAGEIALKRGDVDRAIAHFDRAVRYEDALSIRSRPTGTCRRDRTSRSHCWRPIAPPKPRRCCGKT